MYSAFANNLIIYAEEVFQTKPPYPEFYCPFCRKMMFFKKCTTISSHFSHYNNESCSIRLNEINSTSQNPARVSKLFQYDEYSYEVNDFFTQASHYLSCNWNTKSIRWAIFTFTNLLFKNTTKMTEFINIYKRISVKLNLTLLFSIVVFKSKSTSDSEMWNDCLDFINILEQNLESTDHSIGYLFLNATMDDDYFALNRLFTQLFREPNEDDLCTPDSALKYLLTCKLHPKAIEKISKSPHHIVTIIKRRKNEFESSQIEAFEYTIAEDANASYNYADHLNDRFEIGEAAIANDCNAAIHYSIKYLRGTNRSLISRIVKYRVSGNGLPDYYRFTCTSCWESASVRIKDLKHKSKCSLTSQHSSRENAIEIDQTLGFSLMRNPAPGW